MNDKKKTGEMLRQALAQAKDRVSSLSDELFYFENNCKHEWSKVVYDPKKSFESRYDPEGDYGRGSDFYHGSSYHEVDVPRWKRECQVCGKIDYTERKEKVYEEKPIF